MKKFLSVLLVGAMAMSLAACGSSSSSSSAESDAAEETSEAEETEAASEETGDAEGSADGTVYHVGIIQLLEHDALDAATKGFEDALVELLGEDGVEFDFQNAQGEETNCATIATGFVANDVDLIMANATAALQASSAATADIPILGTSITDYATALNISDWDGTSGTNISGTSDLAPIDEQMDMLVELIPDVTKVGILYCSAEPNSQYQAKQAEAALDEKGIAWEEYTAADSNEIQTIVTNAVTSCDALYVPTDNTMAANVEIIKNIAVPAGVPMIAGEEGLCAGGVATLSISYYDLGYTTGKMAYEVLVNGADVSSMEIQYAPNVTKEYNPTICEELGITVPDDYVAIEGY
ncbi:MAG: ABC transporter substrate-binding protein [Lachnospiraceae bacterium]|nr:ABC transporter substrate-binding protein [Lachnospiraceae bacterium]